MKLEEIEGRVVLLLCVIGILLLAALAFTSLGT